MTPRRPWYAHGHRLEQRWDAWRGALKARLGWRTPAMIQAFRGYGDGARVRLKGRVLELGGRERWRQRTGRWSDLVRMYHRFATDEVPGARVRASFAGRTVETVSDEEGYFEVALDGFGAVRSGELWRPLELELLAPLAAAQPPPRVAAPVLVPPSAAGFAVVSDIDDTIVRTGATSLLRNLRTTLLTSIEGRVAFKGIGAFYRALERGGGAEVVNPIFYVSSSPWNLYDLLERFIELNGIPLGPLFLRDLGWDASKFIRSRHADHKLGAIETLLDFYPEPPLHPDRRQRPARRGDLSRGRAPPPRSHPRRLHPRAGQALGARQRRQGGARRGARGGRRGGALPDAAARRRPRRGPGLDRRPGGPGGPGRGRGADPRRLSDALR